tara:strand:+ start:635 stop:1273 length:639 start_codon:yes stop_codon:yes gene_type:complete
MFITFEGIEGSGKSTQVKLLKAALEKIHFDVESTREPGWGRVGSLIRKIILDYDDIEIEPITELSLFCADRAQHVQEFIKPKLSQGKIVLCDRFYDSTIAYQGYGRGLDPEMVKKLGFGAALGIIPTVTFLIDISVNTALSRIIERPGRNRIDDESFEFHSRVRKSYLSLHNKQPNRICLIDGEKDIDSVQSEIRRTLRNRFSIFKRLDKLG